MIAEGTADELKGRVGGQRLEVTLTHEAAAFAAMTALEGMSEEPPHADGAIVSLAVPERDGAIMEAARRLVAGGRRRRGPRRSAARRSTTCSCR